jgi:5'-3' exonuclease
MSNIPTYIIIDTSYFIFYRYYALVKWWNFANKDTPFDKTKIQDNIEFLKKFEKIFVQKIQEIHKKLKLNNKKNNINYYAAKDCQKDSIWRMDVYSKYKENRVYDAETSNALSVIFNLSYDILAKMDITILNHPRLEGDDCIALTTKYILESNNEVSVYIIANDMDFLQLSHENVKLINLKYEDLTKNKKSHNNPEQDLFCKILLGDKSDNIPGVFDKCGVKTALKCYNDSAYFHDKLKKENREDKYRMNKTLIDFNEIPKNYNYDSIIKAVGQLTLTP